MARRRYVSTEISIDKEVNKLAIQYGDFAALLFTWMIPHAEDDRTITADSYEILNKVVPARRDKSEEDVQEAIAGMIKYKLLAVVEDGKKLKFKPKSFYKYQSYIPVNKREGDEEKPKLPKDSPSDDDERKQVGEIFKFFSNNIGPITPFQSEVIIQYLDEDGLEPQLITQILKDSIGKGTPWDWIKAVLLNCVNKGTKTLAQYEAKKVEKERKKGDRSGGKTQSNKPTFNNFTNRTYDSKKLEEAMIKKGMKNLAPEYDQREGESIEEWQKRILTSLRKGEQGSDK
jgi:DnaD/phage-associated family protein